MKSNVNVSPDHVMFYNYLLKIWNRTTGEKHYKLGKANKVACRKSQWDKKLKDITSLKINSIIDGEWTIEVIWAHECVYYNESTNSVYFMTKNKDGMLFGDDSDDIFRKDLEFYKYTEEKQYRIYIDGEFFSDEGVHFDSKLTDEEIIAICNNVWNKWVEGLDSEKSTYTRVFLDGIKKGIKEFDVIAYAYQKEMVDLISKKNTLVENDNIEVVSIMGSGKTLIACGSACRISSLNDYNPVLVFAGITEVGNTFKNHSEYYTYNDQEIHFYNIYDRSEYEIIEGIKKDKENKIVPLLFLTCQSARKRSNTDGKYEILTDRVEDLLVKGVRFSVMMTDEAHKWVFGDKTKDTYGEIRKYHTYPLNIIHFTGTGFSIVNEIDPRNLLEVDDNEVDKAQNTIGLEFGGACVNLHYMVSDNNDFLKFAENNPEDAFRFLIGKYEGHETAFVDVNNIDCISSFKNGLNTMCAALWVSSIQSVRDWVDVAHKVCSEYFDDFLIISPNGCNKYPKFNGYVYVTNDHKFRKIDSDKVSTIVEIYNRNKKPVFLINCNKFTECWTIRPLNLEFFLCNMVSPDKHFQAAGRGKRTYFDTDENGNVISINKKDTFVFTFGDDFFDTLHNAIEQRLCRNTLKGKNGSGDDYKNIMNNIFSKSTHIHIGDKDFTSSEHNLNELRDIIEDRYIEKENSSLGLVKCMVREFSFLKEFRELIKNDKSLLGYGNLIKKALKGKSTLNGGGLGKKKNKGGKSSVNDNTYDEMSYISAFIDHLWLYRMSHYKPSSPMVSYEDLYIGLSDHPACKDDRKFADKLQAIVDKASDESRKEFMHKVEYWIHKMSTGIEK